VLLPSICFGIVVLLGLSPLLAVGMLLLAASLGGTTANLFSHHFRGDVALNITLTAVNSLLALVTRPFIISISLGYFEPPIAGEDVSLPFSQVLEVFAIVLVPAVVGMVVRRRAPSFAARMDRPVRLLSAAVLAGMIVGAIVSERENLADYLAQAGLAALLICVAGLSFGYVLPRAVGVNQAQATASAMEIGVHNSTLAITIAISVLDSVDLAIPAAVYGVVMFPAAALAGWLITRRRTAMEPTRSPVSHVELATQLVDVTGGLDVVLRHLDLAVGVDHERGPDDALDLLAVKLLRPERAVRAQNRAGGVGQQREGEVLAGPELRQARWAVRGHAQHGVAPGLQLLQRRGEVARLLATAGRHRGRVEVHDHLAATQRRQGHLPALVVEQREVGCDVARLQSYGLGNGLAHGNLSRRRPANTNGSARDSVSGSSTSNEENGVASGQNLPAQRNPDQLVAEIEVTRDRLASTIDQIVDRANPKNVARRGLERVKARFVAPDGSVRMDTAGPVAGGVVGVVVLIVVLRRFVGQ
jgi:BASS family bile acid:Na+ symporter